MVTLVTGATGGLGRLLVAELRGRGREVIATGRNPFIGSDLTRLGARFVPADLAVDDLSPLTRDVDTVFHLAALCSPWGPREAFIAANVTATQRLLSAARDSGCRRFVFTSTPSIYTCAADRLGLTETSPLPPRPANAYAETKLMAERMVLGASGSGLSTIAIRPRAIIGPHDTALLPRLLRAAGNGIMPLPNSGRALIEPTDGRDVVLALLAAESAQAASGQAFNIAGGVPVRLGELVAHVSARAGRKVRLVPVPSMALLAAAGLMERVSRLRRGSPEPLITRYGVMTLGWSQTFDLSAARSALNWAPRHRPLLSVDWALSEMGLA